MPAGLSGDPHRFRRGRAHRVGLDLAEQAFGPGVRTSLLGVRPSGAIRGLVQLQVPFRSLAEHRDREAHFLGMVGVDPVMARVPLLFVVGPGAEL